MRGDAFVTHRVTQLYPEGACVYFYLAIYAQVGHFVFSGHVVLLPARFLLVSGCVISGVVSVAGGAQTLRCVPSGRRSGLLLRPCDALFSVNAVGSVLLDFVNLGPALRSAFCVPGSITFFVV